MSGVVGMTGALVPSLALPARWKAPRSVRVNRCRPLPVTRLVDVRDRSTVYGLTSVDARGRLADRAVMRALGWRPGDALLVRVIDGVIIIEPDADRTVAVNGQGRVHLPAAVRHACGINRGDRVLLAAEPAHGLLRVYSLTVLDMMITSLSGSSPEAGDTE